MPGKGKGPKLNKKVVDKLLDKLSSDDNFRTLFQKDPKAALTEAGWTPTTDPAEAESELAAVSAGGCLTMTDGAELASKEDIAADREALADALSLPFGFRSPAGLLAK
jgi:putative modified peptide